MRTPRQLGLAAQLAVVGAVATLTSTACSQTPSATDLDGGDNPVLGSEGPGAIAEADQTNYGLLVLLAILLIAAGLILVRVEAWARRRTGSASGTAD